MTKILYNPMGIVINREADNIDTSTSVTRMMFIAIITGILVSPGIVGDIYPRRDYTEADNKIIAKLCREIEIPAASHYYIRFSAEDFTLEGKDVVAYSCGLPEKVKEAIAKSPKWMQKELTRQFQLIDAEPYADLILNVSKRYVDEIAFSIACSSLGNVPPIEVIRDNVFSLYENDKMLKYADIVDYDDVNGNYYSTIRYHIIENGVEKKLEYPPEIYYWYVVHPEAVGEKPSHVYNTFWRSYLFHHNDIGYPLLKEKLSDIRYLWDNGSYFQPSQRTWKWSMENHPTAVETVSYWVGKTVPTQAIGDRPGQPNVIAHEHNGWCGELQKITVAALRTALIPSIGICDHGEDHVWQEFYERGWHQNDNWWMDSGGAVDKPEVYVYGWKKNVSALFAWKGDDSIYDVTSRYIHPEDRRTVRFVVLDRKHQPVDGARITVVVGGPRDITWLKDKVWRKIEILWDILPGFIKGKVLQTMYGKLEEQYKEIPDIISGVIPCIWNYTDIDGECIFELGKNRSYFFIIQYGNLKKPWQLAEHNTFRILREPRDTTFHVTFPFLSPIRQKHHNVEGPNGDIFINVSFDAASYQIHENVLWIDDKGVYDREGKISFFVVDETNFERFRRGEQFNCYQYREHGKGNIVFNAEKNNWYLVFKNNARCSIVVLNLSITVATSTTKESVQIVSPNTSVFDHPVFDVGENITIEGIATDDIMVYIDDTSHHVTVHNGEWRYQWNTSGGELGEHSITVACGDAQDNLLVTLIDASPPVIEIEEPSNNEIVEDGVIKIAGYSWDNLGVERVEVSIDGDEWRIANGTNNWSIYWDINGYKLGEHIVAAKAVDKMGRVSVDEITLVVNESGHEWGPQVNSLYHTPGNPGNRSNVIVYADVTEGSFFSIQKVILFWDDGTVIRSKEMYRYGDHPVQDRHEEDPLKNESNDPIFGLELGQFPADTNVTYWIVAYDTAHNIKQSDKNFFTVE